MRAGTHRGPHKRPGLADLGFKATGPASLLRSQLEATAALVFAYPLPGGVEPGPDESRSYAGWLHQQPRADSDDGA